MRSRIFGDILQGSERLDTLASYFSCTGTRLLELATVHNNLTRLQKNSHQNPWMVLVCPKDTSTESNMTRQARMARVADLASS